MKRKETVLGNLFFLSLPMILIGSMAAPVLQASPMTGAEAESFLSNLSNSSMDESSVNSPSERVSFLKVNANHMSVQESSTMEACRETSFAQNEYVTPQSLTLYLDCMSGLPHLNLLGAQWIFLRKAHLVFQEGGSGWKVQYSATPVDPSSTHKLSFPSQSWRTTNGSLQTLMDELQEKVFPNLITQAQTEGNDNNSYRGAKALALSYQATMYQLISFMDTPITQYWRHKETASMHYKGTLLESADFPANWWSQANLRAQFPYLQWEVLQNKYWPEFQHLYKSTYKECETACFLRQERKILLALLAGLEHPDFVKAVHLTPLPSFGPVEGDIAHDQETLPTQVGCYADLPTKDSPTGLRSYDYDLTGDEWRPNYIQMGKWALVGRPIYLEAINKTQINSSVERITSSHDGRSFSDAPAHYMGQNAIIRSLSDRAMQGLMALGGLGGSEAIGEMDGRVVQATGMAASDAVDKYLTKASYLFADYQRKKYLDQSVANHPVVTNPFFTETIISKGYSLKTWADILSKMNPPVFYHIFAYDYEFMPRAGEPWRSYFDRVVYILNQKSFEEAKLN